MKFKSIDEIKNTRLKKYERHNYKGAAFHRSPSEAGSRVGSIDLPDTAAGYKVRLPGEPQKFVSKKSDLYEMLKTI